MTRTYELIPRADGFMSLLPRWNMYDLFFNDVGLTDLFNKEDILMPVIDISETEKEYVITSEIPGVDAKDLDVTLTDGILTIKGEKKQENEQQEKGTYHIERSYGSFRRDITLSSEIDSENIEAECKSGILTLTLPKTEKSKAVKVKVKG